MDTLAVLIPRLVSIGVLLVVVYYFFAIIGIETLHDRVMAGCWYIRNLQVHVHVQVLSLEPVCMTLSVRR